MIFIMMVMMMMMIVVVMVMMKVSSSFPGILWSACALRHSEGAPSQKEQRMSSEQAKEYEKQMHLSAIIAINENGGLRDGFMGFGGWNHI